MSKIILLEESVINKIAAGEVIERPLNVVKELVENAIDSGAGAITVEIKDGGFQLIRVTDNGCGMEREDIRTAFLRHATSKINCVEDLQSVASLGFRGEALASIAAVSQIELLTKTPCSLVGSRYLIEGGKEQKLEDVGCPEGTTLLVKNLFYNTPARKKFMKTPQTEAGYMGDMLQYLALSHPSISFHFINNGQVKMHTSGNGSVKEVIYSMFGRDIAANLCEIHRAVNILSAMDADSFVPDARVQGQEKLCIAGFCGKPVIARGNKNLEMYFINGRYIKNNVMGRAVEDAYKPYMMTRKYPFTALYLTVPQYLVDVNVHPSKMEAQFSNAEAVYQLVYAAVSDALRRRELIPEVAAGKESSRRSENNNSDQVKKEPRRPAEPFENVYRAKLQEKIKLQESAGSGYSELIKKEMEQQVLFDMPLLSEEAKKQHRIIGQVFSTYWLVEFGDKLFIIDQHAAHEKVLYEQKLRAFREKRQLFSQQLAPPVVLSLSLAEQELYRRYGEILTKLGFELESFGGNEFTLRAVPADMVDIADADMFLEFLEGLSNGQREPEFVLERLAMISCKAAVKGGHVLSAAEAQRLIDELMTLENPYHCPHGRPTIISMSRYEMERKFKRIV